MIQTLLAILISLILAFILSQIFKVFGLPKVVGEICAGLILGIGAIKSYFDADALNALNFLANLGIVLMFYYVGLETDFGAATKKIKKSVMISLFNTFLPLSLGFLVMKFILGFDNLSSFIIGASLSVSAQSVSIDILEELRILKSKLGNVIISTGAIDDIIELILITSILTLFYSNITSITTQHLLINILLFVLIIIFSRLVFVPITWKFFDREKSSTSRFMASMIIVLVFSLLSEVLGIGLLIGAMAAGIIVRQTIIKDKSIPNWEEHDIAKSVHIVAFGFLIPLFFVSVGLRTDFSSIWSNLLLIVLLVIIAFIGTIGGTVLGVVLNNGTLKEGLLLGLGLSPKGDIELIIITLALQYGIITQPIFSSLVIMSLITTIISPIIFKKLVLKYHLSKNTKKSKYYYL
jgi:Kef-type K+ transport system membrane component KefB